MSVLKGEGRHVILYGSTAVPIGRRLPTYVARPDLAGRHPVVAVAHDSSGLTSAVKDLCRRLARHGAGVVSPDLYRGGPPGGELDPHRAAADLDAAYGFAVGSGWGAFRGGALVGIGAGGAAALQQRPGFAERMVVLGAPLARAGDSLGAVPLLGLYGDEDDRVDGGEVRAAGAAGGEWILYPGAVGGFWDETDDGYRPDVADDAFGRILRFLGRD